MIPGKTSAIRLASCQDWKPCPCSLRSDIDTSLWHSRLWSAAGQTPAGGCFRAVTAASTGYNASIRFRRSIWLSAKPRQVDFDERQWQDSHNQGSQLERMITRDIRDSSSLTALGSVVDQWGSTFNYIHTSAAFARAAKLGGSSKSGVKDAQVLTSNLAHIWARVVQDSDVQGLSNVLWSSSKLQYTDSSLWSSTLGIFLQPDVLSTAILQQLSNTAYAMAVIASVNDGHVPGMNRTHVVEAFKLIVSQAYVLATQPGADIDSQPVSNIIWACGKLQIVPGEHELTTMFRVFAKPSVLMQAVPQELTSVVYAVSELQQHCQWKPGVPDRVWEQLLSADILAKTADDQAPRHAANLMFALARLATARGVVISKQLASRCAVQLLQGPTARDLSNWNDQDVGSSMWACAALGIRDQHQFYSRIAATARNRLHGSRRPAAITIYQVALACGELGIHDSDLMLMLLKQAERMLARSKTSDANLACTLARACAVLDMPEHADDLKHVMMKSGVRQRVSIPKVERVMLGRTHEWLLKIDGKGLSGILTPEQLAVCATVAATTESSDNDTCIIGMF